MTTEPAPERTPQDDTALEGVEQFAEESREFAKASLPLAVEILPDDTTAPVTADPETVTASFDDVAQVAQHLKTYGEGEPYRAACRLLDALRAASERVPDDTTTPVTAEDLRERVTAAIKSVRIRPELDPIVTAMIQAGAGFHLKDQEAKGIANAVLAALAGDPGEMPERMVVKMRAHRLDSDGSYCVCGEIVEDWDVHRAEAAMLLHSQDHAATVARLAQAEAEVERLADFGLKERERHEAKLASLQAFADRCREKDWAYAAERTRERDEARVEREMLKVAVDHTAGRMSTLELWAHRELTGETLHNVLSVITNLRDALDAPESNEDAGEIEPVENFVGIFPEGWTGGLGSVEFVRQQRGRAGTAPESPTDAPTEET